MSTKLHEAVHRTANKLLDTPEYVKWVDYNNAAPLEARLTAALEPLKYVELDVFTVSSNLRWNIHPLAYKYFKRYGEQYVQLLEATERLTR